MDRIMEIARRHNLVVIEDCAQAHGSRYKGRLVGTIGDFGTFSFVDSKLMASGEGGMVITNNDEWGNYAYSFTYASRRYDGKGWYPSRIAAWNQRMSEFQAAILLIQLERLEEQRKKRVKNAEYLKERLSEIEGITPLKQSPEQNYYSYIFKYDPRYFDGVSVWKFRFALEAEGIPCFSSASHQHPAYRSPCFYSPRRDYRDVFCPVAEKAFEEEAVGIPASGVLLGEEEDMEDIVRAILKIKENISSLHSVSIEDLMENIR